MTRAAAIDSLATALFFTVVAAATEYLVAGFRRRRFSRHARRRSRCTSSPDDPTGCGATRCSAGTSARRRGRIALLAVDTAAFLSFQVPVYAAILFLVGADGGQMAAALGSATPAMLVLSRAFGIFLDWVRRRAGVAPEMPLREPS